MPVRGKQDIWLAGANVLFRRSDWADDRVIDLGTIKTITPSFEIEEVEIEDSRGGQRSTLYKATSKFTEAYEFSVANLGPDNLALIFSSKDPQTWSQETTPLVDVPHVAGPPGRSIKLKNAAGLSMFNLSAVSAVKADAAGSPAATSLVVGTDYVVEDLLRGLIRTVDGGAIDAGDPIYVSMTPVAVTAGARLIEPQSAGGTVDGTAIIEFGRDGLQSVSYRECQVTLSTSAFNLAADGEGSDATLVATVLKDVSVSTFQAGRLTHVKGAVPSNA